MHLFDGVFSEWLPVAHGHIDRGLGALQLHGTCQGSTLLLRDLAQRGATTDRLVTGKGNQRKFRSDSVRFDGFCTNDEAVVVAR